MRKHIKREVTPEGHLVITTWIVVFGVTVYTSVDEKLYF